MEGIQQTSATAQEFTRTVLLAVIGAWQLEPLLAVATPHLAEVLTGITLTTVLQPWQESLGQMLSCGELEVKGFSTSGGLPGAVWTFDDIGIGTFASVIQCERGAITAELQVIKQKEQWLVNMFSLAAPDQQLVLGEPTTLEAIRQRFLEAKQLEGTIDIPAIESDI
jgi:hypothetical protein